MTKSPKSAKVTKGRVEPAKAPIPLSIYPDGEGDDPTSTYDDSRSGSSRRTHEDSSNNVDRSTTPIEGSKSKKPSPRKYGRVKANKCFINRALTTSTIRCMRTKLLRGSYNSTRRRHMARSYEIRDRLDTFEWELVELPARRKPLPCKWVHRYKCVSGSERPKYKAWLVAKGFK